MPWYLKTADGQTYGPLDEATLCRLADEARVGPTDQVSQDGQNWQPATSLPELDMRWVVTLADGTQFGPLSLRALRTLVELGEVSPSCEVCDPKSGQRMPLSEALEDLRRVATGIPAASWRELVEQRDAAQRDAAKWKTLYEQERNRAAAAERDLSRQLDELRRSESAARARADQMEIQLSRLNEELAQLRDELALSSEDPRVRAASWREAYHRLSERYQDLVAQLESQTRAVREAEEARARAEADAQTRIRQMEEIVAREREEARRARERLAQLEQEHLELTRAYRELNDRYIRAKEQKPETPTPPGRIRLTRES